MALIVAKSFVSHSGLNLDFKIDCDALSDADIAALAAIIARRVEFGSVLGIPRGGLRLAKALEPYASVGPRLIVDDVLTTGASMEAARMSDADIGVVIFARGPCPDWVTPVFRVGSFIFCAE